LAYVQHPFPAQGHTTDTAHVIIAGQVTREGTYVALTRAREQTHIYNAASDMSPETDRLQLLAEQVSQTEPEMPSISTPLAQEAAVAASGELEADREQITPTGREQISHPSVDERARQLEHNPDRSTNGDPTVDPLQPNHDVQELDDEHSGLSLEPSSERQPASPTVTEHETEHTPQRTWPGREHRSPEWDTGITRDETNGWEM
jgi:ATP-dependent exoDNAse (exonuclease V) beta subunit